MVVSFIWKKFAKSFSYEVPSRVIRLNTKAKALTSVDSRGGIVLVDLEGPVGQIKKSAIAYSGDIPRGMVGYVIGKRGNTLVIDKWPKEDVKGQKGT